jgi:ATP-dependent Lon protease
MRESVVAALSYIRSRANELQVDPGFLDATDLHIHLPENSLPKDGPSAGITIATGIVSALTKRRVRGDLAMTGEITLHGRILPVGGLREKVLAAHYAHIPHLIIPAENEKDLAEIPSKIRQSIHFTFVDRIDQVIEAALLDAPLQKGQTQAGSRPLRLDERIRDQPARRTVIPADEQEEMEDLPPHIVPPPDRIAGDTYPQIQAQDDDS